MLETLSRAEACRRKAEQYEQTAMLAADHDAKRIYTELARQWRQKAHQAETLQQRLAEKR